MTVRGTLRTSAVAFESVWSSETLVRMLVMVVPDVPAFTVAWRVMLADAPLLSVPTVQDGAAHAPWLGVTTPAVRPAGTTSSRLTLVACAGPV